LSIEERALAEAKEARELAARDQELAALGQWRRTWLSRWAELPESERERIRAVVRGRSELLAGRDDRSFTFLTCCLRELERQSRQEMAPSLLF